MPPDDALSIMLEPAGWERVCGKCDAVYPAGKEDQSGACAVCGGPLSEKRISDFHWKCPECLETGYEPRNYGATVKCKGCRGIFEVAGVKEEKPKKGKAAKEPKKKREPDLLAAAVAAAKEEKSEKPLPAPAVEQPKEKKKRKKKEWLTNQIPLGF